MYFLQEMVSVAVQNVQDMENMVKDPNKNGINGSLHSNGNDPYKHFVSMNYVVLHNKHIISFIQGITSLSSFSPLPFPPRIFCFCPVPT